jgi:hypothetical protein
MVTFVVLYIPRSAFRGGPGYRVYFGWDGAALIILLGGGTKKRQGRDIKKAQEYWSDYKSRQKEARKRLARRCH